MISAVMGKPDKDAGDVLDAFIRELGMPRSLREINVTPEHFGRIAEQAMNTPWVPRNPRRIEGPYRLPVSNITHEIDAVQVCAHRYQTRHKRVLRVILAGPDEYICDIGARAIGPAR